ncbi:NlpC/P60 family protein [Streptomyces sp. NPDC005551]|uniref:NlpC/P60 family protein n=1 Tax=Streptomyces sp. NPDC005551 TaxID=3364725 RepID=UPI0036CC29D7
MASQRTTRPAVTRVAGARVPGLATAALTSVALLSQTANAAPSADSEPSREEVRKKVDDLYHQAGTAAQRYTGARGKSSQPRTRDDTPRDDTAGRTGRPGTTRAEPVPYAVTLSRTGAAVSDAAPLLPAGHTAEQAARVRKGPEAAGGSAKPAVPQRTLKSAKAQVQRKLADARVLLAQLTAAEQARLTSVEERQREAAERRTEEPARQQTAQEKQRPEAPARQDPGSPADGPDGTADAPSYATTANTVLATNDPSWTTTADTVLPTNDPSWTTTADTVLPTNDPPRATTADTVLPTNDPPRATTAGKVLAYARAQIGKPYVWGAMGPDSYDCSGLTRAAWMAAGVFLPRTVRDQADAGTSVPLSEIAPGDLVFFDDDSSHVGLYAGHGMLIHAPRPGAHVREEPLHHGGESSVHSVVRPA